ncbi:MAG: hypothetical protein QM696_13030 [Steroidobacteraceae bacterium]
MIIRLRLGEALAAAVLAAPLLVLGAEGGGNAMQERVAQEAAKPTPKTASGVPDLSGYWSVVGGFVNPSAIPGTAVTADGTTTRPIAGAEIEEHQGNKAGVARRLADTAARPTYKPQFDVKAKANWDRANFLDPGYSCQPLGVPRIGVPNEIVQTPTTLYFLYQNHNIYRVVHLDRGHDPDAERLPMGESVGRWEGDTLVVDVTSLPEGDETWLDGDGSYHSADMHVIERFTRKGNTLNYALTVEDPIFAAPFTPKPKTLLLGNEHVGEDYPCTERDLPHMVTKERH